MAAVPITTRFRVEDYEDAEEWFRRFLEEFNVSYAQLNGAVGGALTRGDNLAGVIHPPKRVAIGAALTADADPFPIFLQPSATVKPRVVLVGRVQPVDGAALPTVGVTPVWDFTGDGRIRVRIVTGLPINSSYDITFVSE